MRALVVMALAGCGRFSFEVATEGRQLVDGASDDASGDAALRFCATHPALFCSDFEDAADAAQWFEFQQANGTYQITTDFGVTTNTIATGTASVYVGHDFGGTATHLRASADIFVETAGTSDGVLLEIRIIEPTEIHGWEYVYRNPPTNSYMEEFLDPLNAMPLMIQSYSINGAPFPVGESHRVEIELDTQALRGIVRHDGVTVLDTALMFGTTNGAPLVAIGVIYLAGPATPWQVRLDNVLADEL